LFLIPLLAAVWLLTVKPANAQYANLQWWECPGGGTCAPPGTIGGTNSGYPGTMGGGNSGCPGDTEGNSTGGGPPVVTIVPGHWDTSYSSSGNTSWHYQADSRVAQSDSRPRPTTRAGDGVQSDYYNSYRDAAANGGKPYLKVLLPEFDGSPYTPQRLQAMAHVATAIEGDNSVDKVAALGDDKVEEAVQQTLRGFR